MSQVYRLKPLGLAMASPDGVIKHDAVQTMDTADLLLSSAKAKADEILEAAAAVYETEKQRGLAEGRNDAALEAVARLAQEHLALDQKLLEIEDQVSDLILGAVRDVIASFEDDALVREITRTALATMRTEKRAQLHVAPEAEDVVRAALADLMADYPEIELIDVIEDSAITAPNLRLESELGMIEFSLDDSLDTLRALLKGA